jgi:putative FmdB family regulatory protein
MPTYEFNCKACCHNFDAFTSMSKKSEIRCPKCGGGELKEHYGAPYLGGNLSNPGAGAAHSCGGSCSSCGGGCKSS